MIASNNQQTLRNEHSLTHATPSPKATITKARKANAALPFLPATSFNQHTVKAGLNPLVDAGNLLFSLIGRLQQLTTFDDLAVLQKELLQEAQLFQQQLKDQRYHPEFEIICRYLFCATLDDVIANTPWGKDKWETFSLLAALNLDPEHSDKFFTILERIIQDPARYIDLMEFMYLCLSLGYKGRYRTTEQSLYQLEQITNHLYKYIRAYHGGFSKVLSPITNVTRKKMEQKPYSPLFILWVTACVILTTFAGLGFLMDVIANEAFKPITAIENAISYSKTSL